MSLKTKTLMFILSELLITAVTAYSQGTQSGGYSKSITAGVATAVTRPLFWNAMVNGGFRMYNTRANLGFGLNTELMWRHKLDNFIVSLTDINRNSSQFRHHYPQIVV